MVAQDNKPVHIQQVPYVQIQWPQYKARRINKVFLYPTQQSETALPICSCSAWPQKKRCFHGCSIKIVMTSASTVACSASTKQKNQQAVLSFSRSSILPIRIRWKAHFVDQLKDTTKIAIFRWIIWSIWANNSAKQYTNTQIQKHTSTPRPKLRHFTRVVARTSHPGSLRKRQRRRRQKRKMARCWVR